MQRVLFNFLASLLIISATAHAQNHYQHYHEYLEAVSDNSSVKRCIELVTVQFSSEALVRDFSCDKNLACHECFHEAAEYYFQSFIFYDRSKKVEILPYQDGELHMDYNGLWYFVLPNEYDETYYEESDKGGYGMHRVYPQTAPKKKKVPNLIGEFERLENKHD